MKPKTTMTRRALLLSLGALPLWSCTDGVEPEAGAVVLAARTTGTDEDADGYTVSVDEAPPVPLSPDGYLTISDLAPGPHRVRLDGVAANCDAAPSSNVEFHVGANETSLVLFSVECFGTGLRIQTSVEGIDDPLFYTVRLDGQARPEQIDRGGSRTITGLVPGTRQVSLGNLPPNCSLTPAEHHVTVTLRVITPVDFDIRCLAATGVVEVKVETSGEDADLGGYVALVREGMQVEVSANGISLLSGVPPGSWEVRLTGIAPNCETVGGALRHVAVTAGSLVRDTSNVSFAVSCRRMWGLAFERGLSIALATEDGATLDLGPYGATPAWSPDGSQLAFTNSCQGICIVALNTGVPRTLAWPDRIRGVSWSPDGARLAYLSERCFYYYYYYTEVCALDALYTILSDGTRAFRFELPPSVVRGNDPAWSPDGSTIVFGCVLAGVAVRRLCVVRPDGTGFRELTAAGGEDSHPSWSPDGSRLVFATTRFGPEEIVTIRQDGTDLRRMDPPLRGTSPAWAPAGYILFRGDYGLARVNADGTGYVALTLDADTRPAPRP